MFTSLTTRACKLRIDEIRSKTQPRDLTPRGVELLLGQPALEQRLAELVAFLKAWTVSCAIAASPTRLPSAFDAAGSPRSKALNTVIERELKRRTGAGKPRQRRALKPGSRHVPVDVEREVRERDGDQCTFTDAQGGAVRSVGF